jgi:hypothetical protein
MHPLYAYAHVPAGYTGDATAQIEAQIERFAPGFRERVLTRHVRSVAQMESYNVNYVGGDVITGSNDARQLVLRPRAAIDPYTTAFQVSTSARPRPRPVPALTACADTMRRTPPCGGSRLAIAAPRVESSWGPQTSRAEVSAVHGSQQFPALSDPEVTA